ncbi:MULTISPECIES: coenzyme F430 synthase [unclassified Methanoregula]|uniref:coenzyme F430 synthase n=1 Tax=unclassified Methanoregula TaxID=2649730 RepID=UPI0009CBF31D|nr:MULTISPECIES: coenzyme F430 synthase [unclassified Methanoregula]OPX65398.1 MAG: UDP-N-acetylmuramoylalanine--D-glutamate ligase [Methanoregula sp. PtaB.Bin085]OPY32307.1 MAG: UDP-N-acetylmuramoylalanine--D-glutamate ligase [Methanoregula sp. PtaU1.Bin006]
MDVLVLDTVHGGKEIAAACREAGHAVDEVDVYHGTTPEEMERALHRDYSLVIAPVHLDPGHPLLARCRGPVITHHDAVRRLLGNHLPCPMIEITGARGKTTTAHALAHILSGRGVLHTSAGTYAFPDKSLLWKKSITPASVIPAARHAARMPGWLVAEVSLGVTGAGDLAILTSPETYPFAGGKKDAIRQKAASARQAKRVLVAEGVTADPENAVRVNDIARCDGMQCTVAYDGRESTIENPLFLLPPYRTPLMLAAAAAMMLHVSPAPLSTFAALPGRMSLSSENGITIVDNSNSGTNAETTLCAARYARHCSGVHDLTLVIGQAEDDGAVCEGFAPDRIADAILKAEPSHVVWIGRYPEPGTGVSGLPEGKIDAICPNLAQGRAAALRMTKKGSIVLSVKTWR